MKIVFRKDEFSEVWDGVFYKKLSNYPEITDWELRTIADFIKYEAMNGRSCEIDCEDETILKALERINTDPEKYKSVPPPQKITECTACPLRRGCETKFVCHTAPVENALNIFKTGSLLSAVRARGLSAAQLKKESRNAAGDPEDYFDYVMFAWGNCQAGDRLVMERKLKRFPTDEDLGKKLTPGVRFYFRYDDLSAHPNAVFDGVLPVKVKDEVKLQGLVYTIIIPEAERSSFENVIPDELRSKVHYIKNDCADIWEWSEKVYSYVEAL